MKPTGYPLTPRVKKAIEFLFAGDLRPAYAVLGTDERVFPEEWYDNGKDLPKSIEQRVVLLRELLEGYLCDMAAEAEEYDDPVETARLRSETLGMLIAIGRLVDYVPESIRGECFES